MSFDVSTGAAYAVLYSVLAFFTFLAIGSAGFFTCVPEQINRYWTLKKSGDNGNPDYFLAARNSASYLDIALSFFAGGMGAWVLYGTTEMGATPALSWLGVIGYSFASAFPAVLISFLGPKIREMSTNKAFSTTDFGRKRYGRVMQVSIAAVSVFYMFIFIVAELTSISNIFALLTNNFSKSYGIGITVSLGAATILYTTFAGLPASIVTDKFQGGLMAILVIILLLAVTTADENSVSREEFKLASNFTSQGFKAMVTLIIAIACAELFNQSTWQRVWAAEDIPAMRKGFFIGSGMVFMLMMFFGVMGMIAYANDPEAYDSFEKFAFLSFFDILAPLNTGWHIVVLILVTALAASSVDSLQNGITSIFARDLVKIGWNPVWITRGLMVVINIPAVYLASEKFDVISLFLVADLVCATSVFPVFLGLQTKDYGILKAPTELGAFLGCVSGVATVLINGHINNGEEGVWEYFWLRNNGICALCGNKTMVSFIVTPLVSLVMTYFFTFVDVSIRGDRARHPLIPVGFDKDDATDDGSARFDTQKDGAEAEDAHNTDTIQAVDMESGISN